MADSRTGFCPAYTAPLASGARRGSGPVTRPHGGRSPPAPGVGARGAAQGRAVFGTGWVSCGDSLSETDG